MKLGTLPCWSLCKSRRTKGVALKSSLWLQLVFFFPWGILYVAPPEERPLNSPVLSWFCRIFV